MADQNSENSTGGGETPRKSAVVRPFNNGNNPPTICVTDSSESCSTEVNNTTSCDGGTEVPPPYSDDSNEINGHNTELSVSNNSTTATTIYTVPKDLSEGLSNPVFMENPDEDFSNSASNNTTATINNLSPPQPASSYTSLTSYEGQYASQTTLFHKDSNFNADIDTEKAATTSKTSASTKEPKEYTGIKKYLGLLLTLSASLLFSVTVLFVKVLKDYGFDAYGSSFWRYLGTVIPTIPLLLFYECGPGVKKQSSVFKSVWPIKENWKTWIGLLSRGLIGSSSVILRYYALQYLTIGDTSVITYSTPVLVTVLAHFFLGEKCGVVPIIIAFTTLCGVVIVTRPPMITGATEFDTDTLIGTGLACGSLLCSALIVIITRKIREVHFTVMTLVFGIIGVTQALILIYFFGELNLPSQLFDSLLVAGVAGLSFLGQMSIVLALKFENAGPVALVRSCDVLFGFLLQYIFLHVIPDMFSTIGAVIVLFGVLSTGFRKWLNTLPEEDRRRKRWGFFLK